MSASRVVIEAEATNGNGELELWAAERRVDLLARLLDRPVVLRLQRDVTAAPARMRASGA